MLAALYAFYFHKPWSLKEKKKEWFLTLGSRDGDSAKRKKFRAPYDNISGVENPFSKMISVVEICLVINFIFLFLEHYFLFQK